MASTVPSTPPSILIHSPWASPALADDQQPGDQIAEQVLRAERHGDPDQPETGEDRRDLDSPDFQNRDRAQRDEGDLEAADRPVDHLGADLRLHPPGQPAQRLGEAVEPPEQDERGQRAQHVVGDAFGQPGERQYFLGEEQADDQRQETERRLQRLHRRVVHPVLGLLRPAREAPDDEAREGAAQQEARGEDGERGERRAQIQAEDAHLPYLGGAADEGLQTRLGLRPSRLLLPACGGRVRARRRRCCRLALPLSSGVRR